MTDQTSAGDGHRVGRHESRFGPVLPMLAWEPSDADASSGSPSADEPQSEGSRSDGGSGDDSGGSDGSSFGAGIGGGAGSSTDDAPAAAPARRKRRSRKKPVAASDDADDREDAAPRSKPERASRDDEGRSADETSPERGDSDEGDSGEDAPARKRRRRGSRGGRRRKRQDSDEAAVAVDVIPGEDDDLDGGDDLQAEAPKAEKRTRRKSRRSKKSADDEAGEAASSEDQQDDADAEADEAGGKKKRRRRRSRRKAGSDEAAGDDEAEDEAEAAEEKGSKKKRKRSRSKKKAGASARAPAKTAEEKAAEAEAMRTQTIAVNAAEPEEQRVAVYEGDRIVDFLMNAESQKTLVNDIYRGRVVNLEPAIGAAFIDFGQGRNGFLHTSDVLPIYGDDGFTLEDLLTAGHHDEEGDHDADWSEEADALDDETEAEDEGAPPEGEASADDASEDDSPEPEASEDGPEDGPEASDDESGDDESDEDDDDEADEPKGRRALRSRSRRPASSMVASLDAAGDDDSSGGGDDSDSDSGSASKAKRKPRKRRASRKKAAASADDGGESGGGEDGPAADDGGDEPTKKRSAKRKRSRKKAAVRASDDADAQDDDGETTKKKSSKKKKAAKKSERKAKTKKKASAKRKSNKKASKARGGRSRGRSERRPQRERRPIDKLLKVGDPVVVQVTKDAIGDKGPTLTTYISMPGRYLVLMPSMSRTGVSRKIPDEKERKRLKRILASLDTPKDMGVIVRTAGVGRTKTDLQRDLDYLLGLWESFGKKLKSSRGPAPLYLESDLATRTLRDLFNRRTKEVVVDDLGVHDQMVAFAERLMPEHVGRINKHEGDRPLFQHCGIEQDFERIFARRVDLPSGGSIVFDQAEALVAIDVNSGRTRTDSYDFEDIALKTNLEAVPEIARQIKLRDLGGIIVCDFIDMMRSSSNRQVERALRDALADDRARSKLGRISQFGLLEMTRQRLGPGTHKKVFQSCTRCRGTARIRTVESRAQAILRRLGGAVVQKGFTKVEVRAHPEVVQYLKEDLWDWVRALEHRSEKQIELTEVPDQPEDSVLRYLRADGREVRPGGRRKR